MTDLASTPGLGLLRLISLLVPVFERASWLKEWHAELYCGWGLDGPERRHPVAAYLRCLGALEDALWLRVRRREKGMLWQDIKYAGRSFARSPGFTLVVLVTLALGIGANTAIFTLVDTVLLRPLPVHEPAALTDIWTTCRRGFPYCSSSYPDYVDYRDRNRTFEDIAAFTRVQLSLDDGEGARLIDGALATGNYFSLLGVGVVEGRLFTRQDDALGDPNPVIVLSHRSWARDFGRDPAVLGSTVRLNGVAYTIVGVAAAGFRGTRLTSNPDLWIPFSSLPLVATGSSRERDLLAERNARWIGGVIGRRVPGVTVEQARADMLSIAGQLEEEYGRAGRTVTVEGSRTITLPAADTGRDVVRFVALLMAVVGAALLIACANIANLMLARATSRRREIGVRVALGAGRRRLVKQLMTESVLLAVSGAVLGLMVATAALRLLSGYALPGFVSIESLGLQVDARVLAFTGVVAVLTGVLFGLVPALQTSNPNVMEALKEASGDARAARVLRTRGVLLSLQTALALVLLIGAGLFVKSLRNGLDSDVGFETRNLAMASFDLSLQEYSDERAQHFLTEFSDRAARLPGVTNVSSAVWPPLARGGSGFFISIDGYTPAEGEELRIEANWVGPDFFRTLGIPLIGGRDISPQDRDGSTAVAVINETMARRWWPNVDPVGRTFRMNSDGSGPQVTIVGVATDVKDGLTDDPEPFVYYPIQQYMSSAVDRQINLLAATTTPATTILPMLRSHLRELDPHLAVPELTTLHNRFAEYLMPQRMGMMLLSTLGGLTMLLAVVGITGVVAYSVNQQRREIGIRLALGATERQVLQVAVRGAVIPVALGVGIGLVVSYGVTRLVTNFMYGVTPTDPVTFLIVPGVLAGVALAAAYLPARRATTVNPIEALRSE